MPEIMVADVVMGGGKTSGAQTYCLENPHQKYIYITPLLDEATRFANECALLRFVEPKQMSEYNRSKILHIEHLVESGRNIACSHVAFSSLTKRTLEIIAEKEYVLICDETVDAIKVDSVHVKDLVVLEKAGMLEKSEDSYKYVGDEDYIDGDSLYTDLCRLSRNNNIYFESEGQPDGTKERYYYLLLPKETLEAFRKIIILTYMFESSNLAALLKLYGMEYEYVGVERINHGNGYMLSKNGLYVPDYIYELKDKIHVYEYESTPIIGRGRPPKNLNVYKAGVSKVNDDVEFSPTYNFFSKKVKQNERLHKELKNNQDTFFTKIISKFGGTKEDCMWSTYKIAKKALEGRGLRKKWVPFNTRATNEYSHKKYISYIVDLHLRPQTCTFYKKHEIPYDQDQWALSTMIQFLWRSRLRKGQDVWLYLPSGRMRRILYKYLKDMSNGDVHGSMLVERVKNET